MLKLFGQYLTLVIHNKMLLTQLMFLLRRLWKLKSKKVKLRKTIKFLLIFLAIEQLQKIEGEENENAIIKNWNEWLNGNDFINMVIY